ncbi:hypothetical protein [Rhizomonospora bruguierae]|uniref:hypothetical protein n=1 Tax=Rhizomonospora bruguierae TaxID=1581705 RepID=UPI001BCB6077|nr:hypothetical protein [Micromonospora sp. NBRC 107566]
MVWLILLGGLVLGLVVLALAAWPVVRRLPTLERALRRLERTAGRARELQATAESLREKLAGLESKVAATQRGRTRP